VAFYFPSEVWVGVLLSLFSYGYILIQCIQIQQSTRKVLYGLLDKTIDAVMTMVGQMEDDYTTFTGGMELPDEATRYMLSQLRIVRGWYESLVQALEIGMGVGITVAALVVLFLHFPVALFVQEKGAAVA